jgi:hypothetical protein
MIAQSSQGLSIQESNAMSGSALAVKGVNQGALDGQGNDGLNLTVDEYLKAVENGLWDSAKSLPSGVANDKEVKEASRRANEREAVGTKDVIADSDHIAFINDIYKATVNANNPIGKDGKTKIGEKTIALGLNKDGQIVVKDIALGEGQGGDVRAFATDVNATAIAHFHYDELDTGPSSGDHGVPKQLNIPNFTVTQRYNRNKREWSCCNVYEVGMVNKEPLYRSIKGNRIGPWRKNSAWQ